MIIELMIMLIVVGAGIVFVAWSNTRRRKQDALERREVEGATGKLKQELERTANEIIGRMEKHVTHLESILDESERNRTQLEGRVVELKKLLKKAEGQSGEIRDLLARLEDAGAEVDAMQRKMETLERRLNLIMTTPLPMQQPVSIPQMTTPSLINPLITPPISPMNTVARPPINTSIPPAPRSPIVPAQILPVNTPMNPAPLQPISKPIAAVSKVEQPKIENEPKEEFDKILEESIAVSPKIEESPRPQVREARVLSSENKQPVKAVDADPVKIEATRKKLTEASAELASNPLEENSDGIDQQQAKDLKKKRMKNSRSKRDVRKAAIEAIKEVEKQNELETKSTPEPKKSPPPDKKESVPERRERKLETTDSSIIKEMLLAGMTIEEISRETGLGRGAIELIQEMTRRQLDRK